MYNIINIITYLFGDYLIVCHIITNRLYVVYFDTTYIVDNFKWLTICMHAIIVRSLLHFSIVQIEYEMFIFT